MAKRFTDTEKFKSKFMRSLKAPYKLLWEYILCDCNHAGIWLVDFEAARLYVGRDVRVFEERALEEFNKKEPHVIPIDNGERWYIVGFIEFQYGALNPRNRVHASVINLLEHFGLWKDGHLSLEAEIPKRKIPHLEEGTYGIRVPLFIDEGESVENITRPAETQTIELRFVPGAELQHTLL